MTKDQLLNVIDCLPHLSWSGFETEGLGPVENARRAASIRANWQFADIQKLNRVEAFLNEFYEGRISVNATDSYALKHVVETILGDYIGNGEFILVAVHAGVPFASGGGNDGLNAVFNFKEWIEHRTWPTKDGRRYLVYTSKGEARLTDSDFAVVEVSQ
jgi:hypothetical protein